MSSKIFDVTGPELNNINHEQVHDFEHFANRRVDGDQMVFKTEHDLEIMVDQPATLHEVQHSNNVTELATAHAAVVLAKAQAAASRQVEIELRHDVELLKTSLASESTERTHLANELSVAREQYIELDKELAIEKTKLEELRKQADKEYYERLRLAKRIEQFENKKNLGLFARLKQSFSQDKES